MRCLWRCLRIIEGVDKLKDGEAKRALNCYETINGNRLKSFKYALQGRDVPEIYFGNIAYSRHFFQPEEVKLRNLLEFVVDRAMKLLQVFCHRFIAEQTFQICLHGCHVDHRGTVLLLQ